MDENDQCVNLAEEVDQSELDRRVMAMEDELFNKNQKRKTKWGPTLRVPRPRRHVEDGRTMLEKAQELKKSKIWRKVKNSPLPLLLKAIANYLSFLRLLTFL